MQISINLQHVDGEIILLNKTCAFIFYLDTTCVENRHCTCRKRPYSGNLLGGLRKRLSQDNAPEKRP